ncbi:glycosyl transferase [Mangrovactinospora gilvigrisea]|uniref:Glycosyl transferase n=1 Tax=Mangrovactinospora gilvigrisea TaxID=1428644 RepID=A0A1J7C4L6_9ACTN|nr:glycosyl transferase [Mangrovactinospora gilvigrisea]
MGTRPKELAALLASVERQDAPAERVVVVGNGADPGPLPEWAEAVRTETNLGCPGGRNVAMRRLRSPATPDDAVDVIVELDDDGLLPHAGVFRLVRERFAAEPTLGVLAFRIADETGHTQRRHIPRLRATDPMKAGPVTHFLGGGHAFSVPMLEQIGDWPAEFFFGHEESDLSWRALDAGWTIRYEPDAVLQHPRTSPARHAVYYRNTARNRVWLARRRLPAVLVPVHLGVWAGLTLARTRSASGLRAWAGGFAEGVRTPCGERRPMRWSTVWRMTRLGRPPVV